MKAGRLSIPYWLETLILFKVCWVLLVIGQNAGILPALLLLAFSFSRHPGPGRALSPVLGTALAGISLDAALTHAGLFTFASTTFPPWLVVLWLAFAHALHNALQVLRRWPLPLVALVGALTEPLSYLVGNLLGAVGFPRSLLLTLGILALCWALLLPLALYMTKSLMQAMRLPLTSVLLIALVLPLRTVPAAAAESHTEPTPLKLLGDARMQVLFRSVYDISLYTECPDFVFPSTDSYRLELQYRMDIASTTLLRETLRQWDARGIEAPPEWATVLAAALPSVRSGDRLSLRIEAGRGVMTHNGEVSARLDDPALVEAFVGIWLAENTTQPQLRRQLLGTSK